MGYFFIVHLEMTKEELKIPLKRHGFAVISPAIQTDSPCRCTGNRFTEIEEISGLCLGDRSLANP